MRLRNLFICLLAVFLLLACGEDEAPINSTIGTVGGGDATINPGADSDVLPQGAVSTTEGPVLGVESDGVRRFLGIPYAKPPVGDLRWKPPYAPEARADLLVADSFGPACPQGDSALPFFQPGPTDEDCLTLNIWTPRTSTEQIESEEPLPVMFWIHGGGFIEGSSRLTGLDNDPMYDGTSLASQDVLVVTINYRLGALGFLAHEAFVGEDGYPAAGNYGLLDQIRALDWVRDNIAGFGGDPDDITILGESAGSVSVCALMSSSLSKSKFDSAVMQSGYCPSAMRKLDEANGELEAATAQAERFAEAVDCHLDAEDVAACMREKSADEVVDAMPTTIGLVGGDGEIFEPIVDGYVLDKTLAEAIESGSTQPVPLMIGGTADQGSLFTVGQVDLTAEAYESLINQSFPIIGAEVLEQYPVSDYQTPRDALSAIIGDSAFICPARRTARAHAANGNEAYTYFFTHVTDTGEQFDLGAYHTAEIAFVFGSLESEGAEATLTNAMQSWWTQFAYDAAPGTAEGQLWPAYDETADEWLQLDTDSLGVTSGVRSEQCDLWDQYR